MTDIVNLALMGAVVLLPLLDHQHYSYPSSLKELARLRDLVVKLVNWRQQRKEAWREEGHYFEDPLLRKVAVNFLPCEANQLHNNVENNESRQEDDRVAIDQDSHQGLEEEDHTVMDHAVEHGAMLLLMHSHLRRLTQEEEEEEYWLSNLELSILHD